MQLIKQFNGHSGCTVKLYCKNKNYFVQKSGSNKLPLSANILNNLNENGFATPAIYNVEHNSITMQYINGVDMKTYIAHADINQIDNLLSFINKYIETFANSKSADISQYIEDKLFDIQQKCDLTALQIDLEELYKQLPKVVPVSTIHGDFTLDNILYFNNQFYLIDANPTLINSVHYDGVKLLQDLDCLWFIRNEPNKTNYKVACSYISRQLKNNWQFLNNHYILVFMLLRILPYANQSSNQNFLIKEINKLWQL